jgi:hypothetical protein
MNMFMIGYQSNNHDNNIEFKNLKIIINFNQYEQLTLYKK